MPSSASRWFHFDVACPVCGGGLDLDDISEITAHIRRAHLGCASCQATYRITLTMLRLHR